MRCFLSRLTSLAGSPLRPPAPAFVLFRDESHLLTRQFTKSIGAASSFISSSSSRMSSSPEDPVERSKRMAAFAAVDAHVKDHDVVGVGSGSTIVYAVQRLGQRAREDGIKVKCVPTSFQARQLILENGLELTSLESDPRCSVTIDGCDEADKDLTLIKGGGGCLAQEKVVAAYSNLFVVIADGRKNSERLGTSYKFVPIEVLPLAYKPVKLTIEKELGGTAVLRMAKAKAGPVVTDNGNFLLDWYFRNEDNAKIKNLSWDEVNQKLQGYAGLVDTGLFVNMAKIAYFGLDDGSIKKVEM